MRRWTLFFCFSLAAFVGSPRLSVTYSAEMQIGKYTFRVADGFTIEQIAAPPLVKYPICADFDEQGRFYVCESSGSIDWNKPQKADSMHKVLRLEDTDGDGVFDKKTVYAEFEMMAQGSMWLNGSLFVAAAPVIWKLTDTNDDGIADQREEWLKTEATTGCLNDLRGPYLGLDGFIYWSKGPALQEYMVDGKPWKSSARHIMRRHPNGPNAEPLMVGGMDNPIEIAFTLGGQRMITCTYIQPPGAPRDDGILHALYGGVYPKDIAPIYEFPWTGPDLLTPLTTWGAVSPAGLMCYQSNVLGEAYQGNLFSAHFNGHRVFRHPLTPKGGTFECTNEELIGCDNVEFHPTDIMEDADGSFIVIETGGWYRNCCPSSTFYRPDVDGAIYRVRHKNAPKVEDPRGFKIDWDQARTVELVDLLADGRPVVRRRATERLVSKGASAIPDIRQALESEDATSQQKLAGIWTLAQIGSETLISTVPSPALLVEKHVDSNSDVVLHLLRRMAANQDTHVRQAALSCLSLFRDQNALDLFCQLLQDNDRHGQRLAAEGLGRLRNPNGVAAILKALEEPTDRSLDHALIYALIEIGYPKATEVGLFSSSSNVRRATLIALDQMSEKTLQASSVIAELNSDDRRLQEAAWWIVSQHPKEWGGMMTEQLQKALSDSNVTTEERQRLRSRIARLARSPELAQWLIQELNATGVSSSTQMLLLQAMAETGGQFAEPAWVEGLLTKLHESNRDGNLIGEIVTTLSKLPPIRTLDPKTKKLAAQMKADLVKTANDESILASTRLRALQAVRGDLPELDDALLDFLLSQMAPDHPLDVRSAAADSLARAKLDELQKRQLAGRLKNFALTELSMVVMLFQGNRDEETGLQFVNSLLGSSAADSLNAFRLKSIIDGYKNSSITQAAKPLMDRLEKSQAEQLSKAENVAKLVSSANPQRGLQVFNSQKAACVACHKAANVGGLTGPALKGIGTRRSDRDLIESIIFPSASIVQSYDSWKVLTNDDQVYTGVLVEDRPDEIVLSAGVEKTWRIPRSGIAEMSRSEQSIMPSGLDKLITDQEFADLVAFLKSLQ